MNTLIVCAALLGVAPTADDGALLTGLVATAAAEVEGVDVLTRADLRAALAVEGEKQLLGCSDESCLAEIAAAMDARAVLFGTVGALGDELVLQLNLFDSANASSAGRAVARGADTRSLANDAEEKTRALVRGFVQAQPAQARTRVLMLDLEVRASAPPAAAQDEPAGPPGGWLAVAGVGVAGVGVLGVLAGGVADLLSVQAFDAADGDRGLSGADAKELYARSDSLVPVAIGGYLVGGALVVGGAALAAVAWLTSREEPVDAPASSSAR